MCEVIVFHHRSFQYMGIYIFYINNSTAKKGCKRQELLALYRRLCSAPVFGRVLVAHCLVYCVVFFVLFVFVLCLVCTMLPVSLDCLFLI